MDENALVRLRCSMRFLTTGVFSISHCVQERLDRAAKSCQDSVRDQMSSDTSAIDRAKYQKQYEDCVSGQVDQGLAKLPNLIQKVSSLLPSTVSAWAVSQNQTVQLTDKPANLNSFLPYSCSKRETKFKTVRSVQAFQSL